MDESVMAEKNPIAYYIALIFQQWIIQGLTENSDTIWCEYEVSVVHAVCENFDGGIMNF